MFTLFQRTKVHAMHALLHHATTMQAEILPAQTYNNDNCILMMHTTRY